MPKLCALDPRFPALLDAQDFVVHRRQAIEAGMTRGALDHRVTNAWQPLLPSVYLCHPGEASRRQRLVAALLYAGPGAAIDGIDACHFYGIKAVRPDDARVHVVVPAESSARSRLWVEVRRTSRPMKVYETERLRYIDPATAVVVAASRMISDRAVLALLSDAVQRNITAPRDLVEAHRGAPRRHARRIDAAIAYVCDGIRSVPEADFHSLAESRPGLPPLLYNRTLLLPDGRTICPDAIAPDAPLIHETNGAVAHRRQDLFEDMQERHDILTATGFTVLHNSPKRIGRHGLEVISEFERCYRRLAGSGWPPGVVLLDDAI